MTEEADKALLVLKKKEEEEGLGCLDASKLPKAARREKKQRQGLGVSN